MSFSRREMLRAGLGVASAALADKLMVSEVEAQQASGGKITGHPRLQQMRPVAMLAAADKLPEDVRQAIINNAGGHVNHSLFWQMMAPNAGGKPTGEIAKAIDSTFGDFDKFKTAFGEAATKRFGSGWAWLVADNSGKLQIISTANQDSPIMTGLKPLLGLDVWEHAYYLKYQNKRPDYITAWWNVVNWDFVNQLYEQAKKA
jgi:superoxide dismutase, Fe-Mn family